MMRYVLTFVPWVSIALLLNCVGQAQDPPEKKSSSKPQSRPAVREIPKVDMTLQALEDRYRIEIEGKLFTEYIFKGVPVPILYPVHGASGVPMTRNYPMKKGVANEATDHVHHRSLWFTHGAVNGHDFWAGKGRIVQEKISGSHGGNVVIIIANNKWVVDQGGGKKGAAKVEEVVCRDTRTIALHVQTEGRFIDYEVKIHASEGDLLFGDTKEGTMAIRLTPSLRLKGKVAKGNVETSEGMTGKRAWGKRAKWIDYWGPVPSGKGPRGRKPEEIVGVAMFDHPRNHGHPCRWHARDYGLFAANPWGIHHFEGAPKGTGDMKLEKGETITLRYRFYFHAGNTDQAKVAEQYAKFAKMHPAK